MPGTLLGPENLVADKANKVTALVEQTFLKRLKEIVNRTVSKLDNSKHFAKCNEIHTQGGCYRK